MIFQSFFNCFMVQISWQGGGYDSGYAKGRIPKMKNVTSLSIRGKHDFVCAAADKRFAMTVSKTSISSHI
jgi:molybdopterin-containing oxidoreductase family iron-sulfur binding subunit